MVLLKYRGKHMALKDTIKLGLAYVITSNFAIHNSILFICLFFTMVFSNCTLIKFYIIHVAINMKKFLHYKYWKFIRAFCRLVASFLLYFYSSFLSKQVKSTFSLLILFYHNSFLPNFFCCAMLLKSLVNLYDFTNLCFYAVFPN